MHAFIRTLPIAILIPFSVSLADQVTPPKDPKAPPAVTAKLLTDVKAAQPGRPFRVAVLVTIEPGWHVYWKNPGDAGMATSVEWVLPAGAKAGPLRWPRPQTFKQPGDVTGYGYSGSVLLWADVTLPAGTKPGAELPLGAKVAWLACNVERCVPGKAVLAETLATADKAMADPDVQKLLADWADKADPAAPAFTLADQDGKPVRLADYAGKTVVLEWINPDCPFVQYHHKADVNTMGKLAEAYKARGVVWLAVNTTHYWTNEKARAYIAQAKLPYPVLDDHAGLVGRAYAAKATPHLYVIDPAGLIVYQGAIDNAPMGQAPAGVKPLNYVQVALDEVLAGKPVTTPRTQAYGCSMKYAAK